MISIILPVVLYLYFRHAIGNVNKAVIEQISNFLFVTNKPAISFQDNVIASLTFTMQKGTESTWCRAEFVPVFCVGPFYVKCFLSKRGAGITLVICIHKIVHKLFSTVYGDGLLPISERLWKESLQVFKVFKFFCNKYFLDELCLELIWTWA